MRSLLLGLKNVESCEVSDFGADRDVVFKRRQYEVCVVAMSPRCPPRLCGSRFSLFLVMRVFRVANIGIFL